MTRLTKHKLNILIGYPGAGKTTKLSRAIHSAIKEWLTPDQILFITFSRGLADETGIKLKDAGVEVRTQHSIGAFLIRQYHKLLGYAKPPIPIDQAEERELCHKLFNSYFLNKGEPCEFSTVWDAYYRWIDHSTKIRKTLNSLEIPEAQIRRTIEFLRSFQGQKKKRSKIGFGDMITQPLRALKDPRFHSYIKGRFRLLVVDENQDMNDRQRRLIDALIQIVDTSVIVGDDGQAIYGFRGAATNAMERLQYRYPEANLIRLDRSYRLTEETAAFVNAFWEHCGSDIRIKGTGHGPRPSVVCSISRNQMVSRAAKTITSLHAEGTPYDAIAVLAPTNRTAHTAARYLEAQGIPFVWKGKSVDNDVGSLLLFLKTLDPNPLHVEDILVEEAGITREQAKLMVDLEKHIPVKRITPGLKKKQLRRSRAIRKAILDIRKKPDLDQILSRFSRVFQGRRAYNTEQSIKHVLRTNGIPLSGTHKDLQREVARYLDEKQTDNNIPNINSTEPGVTINTIHGAKGGEWAHVLLLDVYDEAVFQEERDQSRLFNVGITRPKIQLHLFSLKYESPYKFYQFTRGKKILPRNQTALDNQYHKIRFLPPYSKTKPYCKYERCGEISVESEQ